MLKPSIVEAISKSVSLRRTGKEYLGLCPFHSEKRPSFYVNEEKGFFHCFGCGKSGDVIRFIEVVEKVSFKEALNILGMGNQSRLRPVVTSAQRRAAEVAAAWMADQRRKINILLGDILEEIDLADEIGDSDLAESFIRERSFLLDLYDDLDMSRNAADMLSIRETIELITEGVEL